MSRSHLGLIFRLIFLIFQTKGRGTFTESIQNSIGNQSLAMFPPISLKLMCAPQSGRKQASVHFWHLEMTCACILAYEGFLKDAYFMQMENAWGQESRFKVQDRSMCASGFKPRCWPDVAYHVRRTSNVQSSLPNERIMRIPQDYTDLSSKWCNWGRSEKGDIPDESVCGWAEAALQTFTGLCGGSE